MAKRIYIGFLLLILLFMNIEDGFGQNVNHKQRIACIGNSVTKGYGLSNPKAESYPAQLQKLLGNKYLVGNFGHSGATLLSKGHNPYIETVEYKKALEFNVDIVVILLGLNDTDPRNWPNFRDEFIKDYTSLISSFINYGKYQPKIYTCSMVPIFHNHPRFKSGTRDWFWQIQDAIGKIAIASNVELIDLHKPLYSRPDLFEDALHPNKEGAVIIAQTVANHITGNFGGLQLTSIFNDHMVLQRNVAIPVWGKANQGAKIKVKFHSQVKECIADNAGDWEIKLDPVIAGGPFELSVSEEKGKEIVIKDIMVGEVWLCAGQSNMKFMLKQSFQSENDIAQANKPELRLLNLKGISQTNSTSWDSAAFQKINRLQYFTGKWEVSTPQVAAEFSAIGYYFSKNIQRELDVPVGIIQLAVGGAPAEAFIDRKTLEFNPSLVDVLYNWKENDFIMDWCRKRAKQNISESTNPQQRHPYEPAYLFEAGVSGIAPFPIQGVIWYQGESNAHNPEHYEILFPELVMSWREVWNNSELPFYFAQLSSINRPSWPYFRDTQRKLSHKIPNTAMVVTFDLGDSLDVHPVKKKEIGERFSRLALAKVYKKNIVCSGPEPLTGIQEKNKVIITFSGVQRLATSDGKPVAELETASVDGIFNPVDALIDDQKIIIDAQGKNIEKVRYGWKPFSHGNLINEALLPASTFEINITNKLNTKKL